MDINTYIRKYPQASVKVKQYKWKSTNVINKELNEQISTNTIKQKWANIWDAYLAFAQLVFRVSSYFTNK